MLKGNVMNEFPSCPLTVNKQRLTEEILAVLAPVDTSELTEDDVDSLTTRVGDLMLEELLKLPAVTPGPFLNAPEV